MRERPQSSLLAALADKRVLILAGVQFGFTLGSYGIGIWLPLIIKEHHLSNLAIGFISAVPYLFASVGMMAWAWHVDRTGRRSATWPSPACWPRSGSPSRSCQGRCCPPCSG